MLGPQIMRLLREKWKSPLALAQELYAILQDDVPLTHSGPVTLSQRENSTEAPLTLRTSGDFPAIQFVDARTGNNIGSVSIVDGSLVFDGAAATTKEKCKAAA